jgi:multiple sugar transport system substrate-binding protein
MGKAVFAVVIAFALVAAGCGSSSSNGPGGAVKKNKQKLQKIENKFQHLDLSKLSPSIKDPSSPTTITMMTFVDLNTGTKAWLKLAKEFHQIHPNISVNFESVPQEQEQTKLTAQIAGGNPPDVAYVDTGLVGAFAPRGALVNLSSYIPKSKALSLSDYPPAFRTMTSYQGDMYGLPIDGESTGLFYRTDLFKKAGIKSPPKTWAELATDAKKLTVPAKKQYGYALFATAQETSYYWYPFLYQAGGSQTNSSDTKVAYDSPAGIKAANFYTSLRKYSSPDLWASNSWDARVNFANGNIGMYMAGAWFEGEMISNFPQADGKWASAPLPTETAGSKCATTIAGDALVMPSGGKNHDAAWKWMEFVSAPQNMALLDLGTKKKPVSLLPPRVSMLANPATFDVNPGLRGFAQNMKCGITNLSQAKNWGVVDQGPLSQALAQAIYGKKSPAQALKDSVAQANQDLSQPS